MANFFEDEEGEYIVLINEEGQHSLWRPFKEIPNGWSAVGPSGSRKECLAYVEEHWTDMRPKSLIAKMQGTAVSPGDHN